MDDKLALVEPARAIYRCPGERNDIDRATHLGRLAAFYPACRACQHRADTRGLAPVQIRQWDEVLRRGVRGPRFTAEGLDGDSVNDLGPEVVRRFATALAVTLWRQRERCAAAPAVLVGADGHWTTAELLAAACDALELCGCRAIETGAATTASLAAVAHHVQSDAALWIGNATGRTHGMALRMLGCAGRPWSSPGQLDLVRDAFHAKVDRPKRRGGSRERAGTEESYLTPLFPLFHALRPLRFVVDTTSQPFVRYLRLLNEQAACELLRPQAMVDTVPGEIGGAKASFVDRRLAIVSQRVVDEQAHFGIWIDGAGASCQVVDELGTIVASERLCRLLAAYVCREKPGATLVVESEADETLHRALVALGARVVRAAPTREKYCATMEASGAVFAGGSSGEFWFGGCPPVADALMVISLLLTILSGSDRPMSEVLDAS